MKAEIQEVLKHMIRRASVDPVFWRACVKNPNRAFLESSSLELSPEERAAFNRALVEGIPWFAPSEPEEEGTGFWG